MTEHTKGKLRIDPDDRPDMHWNNHIVSVERPHMTICFMSHDGTQENVEGEANARRLVACWNACEGIPTENLEPGGFLEMSRADDAYVRALLAKLTQKD